MRVAKWGNSLAIRLPVSVVEALELKEGDEVEVHVVGDRAFDIARDRSRERAGLEVRSRGGQHPVNSTPGEFLDTNVLVYAFTSDPRAERAQRLLARGCSVGVQGLNEFTNVARRKLGMNWAEVREALAAIRTLCEAILPIDVDTHTEALRVSERYGCAIFDALVIAAALRADCGVLWSEDMQDGLVVDGRLRIANPFR